MSPETVAGSGQGTSSYDCGRAQKALRHGLLESAVSRAVDANRRSASHGPRKGDLRRRV
ncbi:hypothetical protein K788_0006519 [Paraburkholderia caribensis MBA4]|uniref:Uncharacterized protein n=1 Tax=Paraburkholderia caribensis MBA4 TaxID=1323664 RepID=A0A0P0RC75_9BURK|nr:hypothetical protein K788_0006519 [Paraburkholderia caribensis MBA4]